MADFSFDFSAQTTANPWPVPSSLLKLSVTNFSLTNGTGVRSASNGNSAWGAHNVNYTGGTTPIVAAITYNAIVFNHDNAGAGVFARTGGNAGAGYALRLDETGAMYFDSVAPGFVATQIASTSGLTLSASDVFTLSYVPATGALVGQQNGVTKLTFTDTTYAAETTLAAGWWIDPGNTNSQYIKTFAGTGVATGVALGTTRNSGPGISPDKRTMFRGRQLSAFVAPNTLTGGTASWQGNGYGTLTGTISAPIIGLKREFGPGPSPDYQRTFQRPALSTNVPILGALTGQAAWQGAGYGNVIATASIQGLASWQGLGPAAALTGTGVLTGLATWQGAAMGNLGSGAPTNITGVASWQGGGYGVVTGAGALTGTAGGQGAGRGTLIGAGTLTGTATWQSAAFGASGALGTLSGVASWQGTSAGILLGAASLQGRANGQGQAFGFLLGSAGLTGVASWSGGAYGIVVGEGALSGLGSGQSGGFGSMLGSVQMAGRASWQGVAQGLLLPIGAGQMQGLAAGFSFSFGALAGLSHRFGWADVNALSPNGLPVARACYIEESASFVTAAYFDANGIPFVPSAVQYRVDDVTTGANIVPWTNVSPSNINTVTITSEQNAMISQTRSSEAHQVLFKIADGFGNVSYADVAYDLIRVAGLG